MNFEYTTQNLFRDFCFDAALFAFSTWEMMMQFFFFPEKQTQAYMTNLHQFYD